MCLHSAPPELGNLLYARSINIPRLWRRRIGEFARSIAQDRFGSHLRFCGLSGQHARVVFLSDHCQNIEVDYQSGPERLRSKSYADLIYARASIYWSIAVPYILPEHTLHSP